MKTKISIFLVFLWNVSTCSLGEIKPTFLLKHKNATMPVVVRGNLESNVLIVFLHGGPGGTAFRKIGTRAFVKLEEDFGIVYWDQRGAETARGGTGKELMSLDQFVEDLDVLIDRLKKLYPQVSIFLMGHCWGGGLGTAFLIDKDRQSKVAGWIDVAGAHNNPKGDSLSVAWVKAHAMKMISQNEDVQYWSRALKWYDENPSFKSDQLGHYQFVRKAHGYQLVEGDSLGLFPCYTQKDLLIRPVKYISYYLNYYNTLSKFIISDIDLTPHMHKITVPSLILWGKKDGLIPVPMAYEAYTALGTPEAQKHLVLMEETAHTIFYEQPQLFVMNIKQFINSYTGEKLREINEMVSSDSQ
ncbi:MAG: alpha/beta fold hydrolase [Bacteroidota bacterium]